MPDMSQSAHREPVPNKGRFQRGDARINRDGRPRGSKAGADADGAFLARRADRLMQVVVPARRAVRRLGRYVPKLVNLPPDVEMTDSRVDDDGNLAIII